MEKPKEKPEEGVADNYGVGFGELKGRNVTSEWSRWVTFAGDNFTWEGERLQKREELLAPQLLRLRNEMTFAALVLVVQLVPQRVPRQLQRHGQIARQMQRILLFQPSQVVQRVPGLRLSHIARFLELFQSVITNGVEGTDAVFHLILLGRTHEEHRLVRQVL